MLYVVVLHKTLEKSAHPHGLMQGMGVNALCHLQWVLVTRNCWCRQQPAELSRRSSGPSWQGVIIHALLCILACMHTRTDVNCTLIALMHAECHRHMHACRAAAHLPAYMSPFACTVPSMRLCNLGAALLHRSKCMSPTQQSPQASPQPTTITQSLHFPFVMHLACAFQLSCSWLACFNFPAPASVDFNWPHL